jgi:hypothetical protein
MKKTLYIVLVVLVPLSRCELFAQDFYQPAHVTERDMLKNGLRFSIISHPQHFINARIDSVEVMQLAQQAIESSGWKFDISSPLALVVNVDSNRVLEDSSVEVYLRGEVNSGTDATFGVESSNSFDGITLTKIAFVKQNDPTILKSTIQFIANRLANKLRQAAFRGMFKKRDIDAEPKTEPVVDPYVGRLQDDE